jgi:hypothetical protein
MQIVSKCFGGAVVVFDFGVGEEHFFLSGEFDLLLRGWA